MTVVAAVDSSARSSAVLSQAFVLAADIDEPLHAVHVLRRSDFVGILEKQVEGQPLTDNYEIRRLGEEIVERASRKSASIHDIDAIETVVRVGDPPEELTAYADEIDARYLVVGGRKRSPTGKALFGSVTQQVMFETTIPVLNVPVDER